MEVGEAQEDQTGQARGTCRAEQSPRVQTRYPEEYDQHQQDASRAQPEAGHPGDKGRPAAHAAYLGGSEEEAGGRPDIPATEREGKAQRQDPKEGQRLLQLEILPRAEPEDRFLKYEHVHRTQHVPSSPGLSELPARLRPAFTADTPRGRVALRAHQPQKVQRWPVADGRADPANADHELRDILRAKDPATCARPAAQPSKQKPNEVEA